MQKQSKLTAVAISIPFLLFMAGEQQAHPLPDILRGEAELQSVTDTFAPPAVSRTTSAQGRQTAKTAVGKKHRRTSRKRPRNLARKAKSRPRRKPGRGSTSAVAARRLHILKREHIRRTRRHLVITDFNRTPGEQARAIRRNAKAYGIPYVLRVYRSSPAIREILSAYRANRRKPQQAQKAMTRVIEEQVARGVYVSDHMRGRAVDIRSRGRNGANLSVLRAVAREMGGKVLVEKDHYHFKLV